MTEDKQAECLTPEIGKNRYVRFVSRRCMAWAAFIALTTTGCTVIGFGILSDEYMSRVKELTPFMSIFFSILGGIVATYYGITGWVNTTLKR